MIIKSSLKLKSNVKRIKRFSVGNRVEHKEMYKIKKCGTHLTFLYNAYAKTTNSGVVMSHAVAKSPHCFPMNQAERW